MRLLLKTPTIDIQIVRKKHNLPVVFDSVVPMSAKQALATTMCSGLCHSLLNALNFFHKNNLGDLCISPHFWHHKSEHYSHFCGPCVGAPANKNLSGPQKELLEWHWKLGIGMYCIRSLMCKQHYDKPDGKTTILPAKI